MTSNGEVRTVSSTGAEKGVKPEAFDLIPPRPLLLLARFYGVGSVDFDSSSSLSAVFDYVNEQLWEFWGGSDTDPDSGMQRLIAAAAGCFWLFDTVHGPTIDSCLDDRPGKGHVSPRSVEITHPADATHPQLMFSRIPYAPLAGIARHYGAGAAKYARHNWSAGYEWSKPFAALQRHLWSFWSRDDIDEETGSPHIVASAWHCLTLAEFAYTHPEFDDRPVAGTMLTRMDTAPMTDVIPQTP